MIVDLIQNTPEWHNWRKSKIGASDTPIILGLSDFMTRYQLYETKLGLRPQTPQNVATSHGHEYEDLARRRYIETTGIDLKPICVEMEEDPRFVASLDGYNFDQDLIVEIKCPYGEKVIDMAEKGEVPQMYKYQLQHQMLAANAVKAHYWCFDAKKDVGHLVIFERDKKIQDEIIEAGRAFLDNLKTQTPPPLTEKDYFKDESEEMKSLVSLYTEYDYEAKTIQAKMAKIKKDIVSRMTHNKVEVDDCKIYEVVRRGNVDYDKILKDKEIDVCLDDYRKKPSKSVTIKLGGSYGIVE